MRTLYYSIIVILLSTGCGFKVIDQLNLKNINLSYIETTGDNRIGYNIKKKLQLNTKNTSSNIVGLIINIEKKKDIKEKDASNEITKYLTTINLIVKVEKNNKAVKTLNLSDRRDYNVSSQYSQTIVNENEAIKALTNLLTTKLIKELSLINFDDF